MLPKDIYFDNRRLCIQSTIEDGVKNYTDKKPYLNVLPDYNKIIFGQPSIRLNSQNYDYISQNKTYVDNDIIGYVGAANTALKSFTVRFWMMFESANFNRYQKIFGFGGSDNSSFLFMKNDAGKLVTYYRGFTGTSTKTMIADKWYYIQFSYKSGVGGAVSIDGTSDFTFPALTPTTFDYYPMQFANHTNLNESFSGWMQDIVYENTETYSIVMPVPTDLTYREKQLPVGTTGTGVLSGEVLTNSAITPLAKVSLFTEDTKEFVAKTMTDPDGKYTFTNLNKDRQFFVVIENPNSNWEYKVNSRRNPI